MFQNTARWSAAACAILLLVPAMTGCEDQGGESVGDVDPERRLERARSALADPLRPDEDRARDEDRRPAEVLAFCGIDEGMRVVDLQTAQGFYAELLSTVVGPEGHVYAQNNDFVVNRFADKPLGDRIAKLKEAGRTNITRVDAELDELELPGGLDAAMFVRFYHDLFWLPTPDGDMADRKEFLRRVHEALAPGGVFCVVDHHAEAGSGDRDAVDPREGLHRIDVELVRREVLAAGFVLDAESDVLRNENDTRDWNIFVDDGARRDKTDRFVLRFRKPPSYADRMATEHAGDRPVASGAASAKPAGAIDEATVTYAMVGGRPVEGFLARPAGTDTTRSGLIVIQEWWGLNDNIRSMARRLAGEGYTALAVDLYGGEVAEDAKRARELMMAATGNEAELEENLRQAHDYLRGELGVTKVGTIGWCFGGGWSLRTALLLPGKIDATVIYYGRVETDRERLAALQTPILGIFGAEDQGIPLDGVRAFERALDELGKQADIQVYEGAEHAFANPSGTRYNAEAAEDAWVRTLAFFADRL